MQAPKLALTVQYATRSRRVPARADLRAWTAAALRRDADITLRVVGTRESRALNHRYRSRDYATNVLTFVYADQHPLAGDIAVCAPVAAREARARGVALKDHYAHLVVHGVLHLQGHDHGRARDAARMERLEARILARLGIANPYREERGERKEAERGRSSVPTRRPCAQPRRSPLAAHRSPSHGR
jgi:probable rRNA maturation factor